MPIADGTIFDAVVRGSLFGQETQNVLSFAWNADAPGSAATVAQVGAAIAAHFQSAWEATTSEDWTGLGITIRDVSEPQDFNTVSIPVSWQGDIASEALPPHVAAVISKIAATGGRKGRGRIFVAGLPQAWHTAGRLDNGPSDPFFVLGGMLDDEIPLVDPPGTLRPQVYSREDNTGRTIIESYGHYILRAQRRREIGVGI